MKLLVVSAIFCAYCRAGSIPRLSLQDSLPLHEYDFGKVIRTDKIVINSLNSIRTAVDCLDTALANVTKLIKGMKVWSVPELILSIGDVKFIGDYIVGQIEGLHQYCPHASSKLDVMFTAVDYMFDVCNNFTSILLSIDHHIADEERMKKELHKYIVDVALVGRFFYDSCDKIMTPLTFLDSRNIELRNYMWRFPDLAKSILNDTLNNGVDIEAFVRDSEDIHSMATLMLNVTERIKLASKYLLVGNETTENKTINATKKFTGYEMLQSNIIFLIGRGVSTFMKVTKQKYVTDNSSGVVNRALLEDEDRYFDKDEAEISVDKSVCEPQKLAAEINSTVTHMLEENTNALNLSTSIGVTLFRLRRHRPATKELSRLVKRDAIRIKTLMKDIMYRAKYLISVIKTCYPEVNRTRKERECYYLCTEEIKPVCGIDRNLGYTVFLNKCLLFGHNTCKGTSYVAFDLELCMTILIRNPHLFRTVLADTTDFEDGITSTLSVLDLK